MRAACGRAQMAIFGRREGSLAAGSPMLRVTEDEHGDAHGEHVEARISGASGSWCSWCRRGAHGGGLRGAGDAVVVMVNVAAGLRACRCPGRREMISPRGPLEVAGRHRRTTARQAFQTTAATMPAPGTGRQGELVLQPARPRTGPQPQPPGSPGNRQRDHQPGTPAWPWPPTPPDAHAVVAHQTGHRPPSRNRHAHAERRRPPFTCSGRVAWNSRPKRRI